MAQWFETLRRFSTWRQLQLTYCLIPSDNLRLSVVFQAWLGVIQWNLLAPWVSLALPLCSFAWSQLSSHFSPKTIRRMSQQPITHSTVSPQCRPATLQLNTTYFYTFAPGDLHLSLHANLCFWNCKKTKSDSLFNTKYRIKKVPIRVLISQQIQPESVFFVNKLHNFLPVCWVPSVSLFTLVVNTVKSW